VQSIAGMAIDGLCRVFEMEVRCIECARTRATESDPDAAQVFDLVIRLGQGEQESDCLDFGADGELVIVSAQAQEVRCIECARTRATESDPDAAQGPIPRSDICRVLVRDSTHAR
jgi:ribosomal protein S27E